jgi:hypothetical protein
MDTWAMILSGVIVNIAIAGQSDYKYPPYTWVDITNYPSQYGYMPGIGWTTTDNINFTQPSGD